MIIIKQEIREFGYYLVYDGVPPQGTKCDEAGGIGNTGLKDIEACITEIKKFDLIQDFKDVVLFFGINIDGVMRVDKPFGFMTGQDFLESR